MDRTLSEKIWRQVEPLVEAQGYEVVEIEAQPGKNGLIRIYLDGTDGISVDKCAEFSRAFSEQFDADDPLAGAYMLEVSSPGLDRPMRKPAHFAKQLKQTIAVKIVMDDRPKKMRGTLLAADANGFTLKVEGSKDELSVAFTDLLSAHLVYDFSTAFKSKQMTSAAKGSATN